MSSAAPLRTKPGRAARSPSGRPRPHRPGSSPNGPGPARGTSRSAPRAALPPAGRDPQGHSRGGGSVTKREPRDSPAEVRAPQPALLRPPPPPQRDLPALTSLVPAGRVGGKAHPKGAAHLCRPAPLSLSPPPGSGRFPLPQPPRCRSLPPSGAPRLRPPPLPRARSRSPGAGQPPVPSVMSRPSVPSVCPVRAVPAVCPVRAAQSVPPRRSLSTGHSRRSGGPGSWDSHWPGGGGRRGRCCEKPREAARGPGPSRSAAPRGRARPWVLRQRLGREAGPCGLQQRAVRAALGQGLGTLGCTQPARGKELPLQINYFTFLGGQRVQG